MRGMEIAGRAGASLFFENKRLDSQPAFEGALR
jgi:hypothetical protein